MNKHYNKYIFTLTFLIFFTGCAKKYIISKDAQELKDPVLLNSNYGELGLVVSISGGGIRASNLAIGVLLALDSIKIYKKGNISKSLLDELDIASTVSGGGLGVGIYIAEKYQYENNCNPTYENIPFFQLLVDNQVDKKKNSRLAMLRKSWSSAFISKLNPKLWKKSLTNIDMFIQDYFKPLLAVDCKDKQTLSLYDAQNLKNSLIHVPNATISSNGFIFPFTEENMEAMEFSGYLDINNGKHSWVEISSLTNEKISEQIPYAHTLASSAAFPPILSDVRFKTGLKLENKDTSYIHLTDGGQADDNGYKTSLKYLDLISKTNKNRPVLYIAVDALPSNGGSTVTNQTPASVIQMLSRNMDLPRYGGKRQLQKTIYFNHNQERKTDLDNINGNLYAVHLGLWEYPIEKAKVGTIDAGIYGLEPDEQQATIKAGMLMTYEALFGIKKGTITKGGHAKLNEKVDNIVNCIITPNKCSGLEWKLLESYLNDEELIIPKSLKKTGMIEFRRQKKIEEWENRFSKTTSNLQLLLKGINSEYNLIFDNINSDIYQLEQKISKNIKDAAIILNNSTNIEADISFREKMSTILKNKEDLAKEVEKQYEIFYKINSSIRKISNQSKLVYKKMRGEQSFPCSCDSDSKNECVIQQDNNLELYVSNYQELNPQCLVTYLDINPNINNDRIGHPDSGLYESFKQWAINKTSDIYSSIAKLFLSKKNERLKELKKVCLNYQKTNNYILTPNLALNKKLRNEINTYIELAEVHGFFTRKNNESNFCSLLDTQDENDEFQSADSIRIESWKKATSSTSGTLSKYVDCMDSVRVKRKEIYKSQMQYILDRKDTTTKLINGIIKHNSQCSRKLYSQLENINLATKELNLHDCVLNLLLENEDSIHITNDKKQLNSNQALYCEHPVIGTKYYDEKNQTHYDTLKNSIIEKVRYDNNYEIELNTSILNKTEKFQNIIDDFVNTFNKLKLLKPQSVLNFSECYSLRNISNIYNYKANFISKDSNNDFICEYIDEEIKK